MAASMTEFKARHLTQAEPGELLGSNSIGPASKRKARIEPGQDHLAGVKHPLRQIFARAPEIGEGKHQSCDYDSDGDCAGTAERDHQHMLWCLNRVQGDNRGGKSGDHAAIGGEIPQSRRRVAAEPAPNRQAQKKSKPRLRKKDEKPDGRDSPRECADEAEHPFAERGAEDGLGDDDSGCPSPAGLVQLQEERNIKRDRRRKCDARTVVDRRKRSLGSPQRGHEFGQQKTAVDPAADRPH